MVALSGMELSGELAPPMANGEVIFEAPWQSRVFGLARVLCEAGHFEWDEFRSQLIRSIDSWEQSVSDKQSYEYFDRFLEALSILLTERGLCAKGELESRTQQFEARPHGHDH